MSDHFERGARVQVCDGVTPEPGTVTGWHHPQFAGLHLSVELDDGDTWYGLADWCEPYQDGAP